MNDYLMVGVLLSLILTSITSVFSILAYAKVVGMEKSTHTIVNSMTPVNSSEDGATGKSLVDGMKKAFYPEEY